MPGIFINYRREDAMGFAGALARELKTRFNEKDVFMDVSNIHGGDVFPDVIKKSITSCDVILAFIGSHWLDAKDEIGNLRIYNKHDYVRNEILWAIENNVRVIPILLEETKMPKEDELPDDLKVLRTYNAIRLSNEDWETNVNLIVDEIRKAFYSPDKFGRTEQPTVPTYFDPGEGSKHLPWIISNIFLIVGLSFFGLLIGDQISEALFRARALEISGEVVDYVRSDNTFSPKVEFTTPQGKKITFVSGVGSDPPAFSIGEIVGIRYDPNNPHDAEIKSALTNWFFPLFTGAFFFVFFSIGLGLLLYNIAKRRKWKQKLLLTQSGRPIMTTFVKADKDESITTNDQHPFQIVTKWNNPITDETMYFTSGYVWKDPSELLKNRSILVLIDPNNFDNYLVDLSNIPKEYKKQPAVFNKNSQISMSNK